MGTRRSSEFTVFGTNTTSVRGVSEGFADLYRVPRLLPYHDMLDMQAKHKKVDPLKISIESKVIRIKSKKIKIK